MNKHSFKMKMVNPEMRSRLAATLLAITLLGSQPAMLAATEQSPQSSSAANQNTAGSPHSASSASPSTEAQTTSTAAPTSASTTPSAAAPITSAPGQAATSTAGTTAISTPVSAATAPGAAGAQSVKVNPKVIFKPGEEISVGTVSEDLVATYDIDLARKQVAAYPDNPEAAFILAVALSRTSHVEEALQEIRQARKLAEAKGGPFYFDKMIANYEEMLKNYPHENQVKYGLAWAYYMKAYLTAKYSKHVEKTATANNAQAGLSDKKLPTNPWEIAAAIGIKPSGEMPHLQGALERADAAQVPQIRKYYEAALGKLDEILVDDPKDIWSKVYRAFLNAEYTGNLDAAMKTWRQCLSQAPDNPAPYFFLGEGYLRQGNLKDCLDNISKAIALRAVGK